MSTLWEKDTIKSEWKKIKHLTFKEKLEYIWGYYKWPICIITALAILMVLLWPSFIEGQKDTIIRGAMINKFELFVTNTNYFADTYSEFRNLNEEKENVELQTTLYIDSVNYQKETLQTYQNLMAQIITKELDFITADQETLETYNKTTDVFFDLRDCLPADLYERLEAEGRIVWIHRFFDGEQIEELIESEETYPLLIDISDTHITKGMRMSDTELMVAFITNSQNVDEYPYFIEYLLDYEPPVEETTTESITETIQ